MCGIVGIWSPGGLHPVRANDAIAAMAGALAHRGPDDAGVWVDAAAGIALGHRRLSILDLSPAGHQPMISATGRYVLSLNGEIYNHAELRREFQSRGERFRGHSDTEVFLAAIAAWGLDRALARANGMFAFALWDRSARTLHLARDRAGEKPLYYGWSGATLVFGSELKALAAFPGWNAAVDRGALALFLRHNYVPAPHSIYAGIRKLLPGSTLAVPSDLQPGQWPPVRRYWSVAAVADSAREAPFRGGRHEAADALDALLRDAVRLRMHADVPVGAFLSGGIDSSTIVALMQAEASVPVHTFSIGFDDAGFDEAVYARRVAAHLGTHHTELYVRTRDAMAVIPQLPHVYDEPFADSSQIPTILVSRLARRDVTISLSGDAGDELFGGYPRYGINRRAHRRLRLLPYPLRRALGSSVRRVPTEYWDRLLATPPLRRFATGGGRRLHRGAERLGSRGLAELYRGFVSQWENPTALVAGALEPPTPLTDPSTWTRGDDVHRMMLADFVSYLPDDILVKVDRATMSVALEARVPLLDPRVIRLAWETALGLPADATAEKRLLRDVLARYVPGELVERPKMGFGVPIGAWLRDGLRDWAEDLLSPDRLRREGYLSPAVVRAAWQDHVSGRRDEQGRIWTVLMFQAWLQHTSRAMDGPSRPAALIDAVGRVPVP